MSERIRIAKGLRKHIRTQLGEARAAEDNNRVDQIKQLRATYRILKQQPHVRQIILEPIPAVDYSLEARARDINLIAECKTIYDFIQTIRHQGVKDYTYIKEDAMENRKAIPIIDIPYKSDYISVAERFGVETDLIGEPGTLVRNYGFFYARTAKMDTSEKFMVRGNLSREKVD